MSINIYKLNFIANYPAVLQMHEWVGLQWVLIIDFTKQESSPASEVMWTTGEIGFNLMA